MDPAGDGLLSVDSPDVSRGNGLAPSGAGPTSARRGSASVLWGAVAVLGLFGPAVFYLWFVGHYGQNIPYNDDWRSIQIVAQSLSGHLTPGALWAVWSVGRDVIPRFIFLLLGYTTHLNFVVEMFLSALLLIAAVALIILSHRRRWSNAKWIYYCPVAIVLLSVVQYQNTLFGTAVSWYLVLTALALAVFLLDRPLLGWVGVGGAIAAAAIGSLSWAAGFVIWPVGLLLLYQRKRPRPMLLAWCAVAAALVAVYFYGYHPARKTSLVSDLRHPLTNVKFFFYALGDVVGVRAGFPVPHMDIGIYLFGIAIFVVAVWVLVKWGLHRGTGASSIGVAMLVFGLVWALVLSATQATTLAGLSSAALSRYTTYDVWILVGVYLALLGGFEEAPRSLRSGASWMRIAMGGVVAAMCLQVVMGTANGLDGGRLTTASRDVSADVLVNFPQSTTYQDATALPEPFTPEMTYYGAAARRHHLTLFATGTAAVFARTGLTGGLWAGSTSPHAQPWRNVHQGQLVKVTGTGFSGGQPGAFVVTECNQGIVTRALNLYLDAKSCAARPLAAARPDAAGAIRVAVRVRTGPVGNGTCDSGKVCYLAVRNRLTGRVLALTEILIASSSAP